LRQWGFRRISQVLRAVGRFKTEDYACPIAEERVQALREVEKRIHYRFKNLQLVDQALTHRSYAHEVGDLEKGKVLPDYEALEFLGDSILGFVISEFLCFRFPDLNEGELSKMKSHLVSATQLHSLSKELGLGEFMNLSRGEEKTGGRHKKTILADLFESLTAAVYLDSGYQEVKEFILSQYQVKLEEIEENKVILRDHKSTLQEKLHQEGLPGPQYEVVKAIGPDHRKQFVVSVTSKQGILAEGTGRSKKEAEQQAAKQALQQMERGRDS
jgi:ribonuclease-3